jgi:hypothetical protein
VFGDGWPSRGRHRKRRIRGKCVSAGRDEEGKRRQERGRRGSEYGDSLAGQLTRGKEKESGPGERRGRGKGRTCCPESPKANQRSFPTILRGTSSCSTYIRVDDTEHQRRATELTDQRYDCERTQPKTTTIEQIRQLERIGRVRNLLSPALSTAVERRGKRGLVSRRSRSGRRVKGGRYTVRLMCWRPAKWDSCQSRIQVWRIDVRKLACEHDKREKTG